MALQRTNKQTGDMGERVAATYLSRRGHTIINRNYRVPQAEIDIVSRCNKVIHFVEVKTVSYETKADLVASLHTEDWRPEDQVHQAKLRKLGLGAEAWIRNHQYTGNWQIDVAAVRVVPRETYATVNLIANVTIE
jgi:putative endonuclease